MTVTYDLIASNVLSSTAASVTFSSISASYRDLVLVVSGPTATNPDLVIELNGDTTAANYSNVNMYGNGSTATSGTGFRPKRIGVWGTGSSNFITQFLDYSATNKHKTYLSRVNDAGSGVWAAANRWANTAAINEIKAVADGTTWASGTTFYLYGIVS